MTKHKRRVRRVINAPQPVKWALWGVMGVCIGFFLGTFTLLGPVRWAVSFLRQHTWGRLFEDAVVMVHLTLLVVVSFGVAGGLNRFFWTTRKPTSRWLMLGGVLLAFSSTLGLWMNPQRLRPAAALNLGHKPTGFVFGPYPDEATLRQLKRQGYTGVVSLLHPAVMPFEPVLIRQERAAAARVGLKLVEAPMLPWVSENEVSVEKLRRLTRSVKGGYYVHCYLGQDRVRLVQRFFDQWGVAYEGSQATRRQTLASRNTFERGPILRLSENVFLGPSPTDEEFMTYIVNGGVKHLVSLLAADSEKNLALAQQEKDRAKKYGLGYAHWPFDEKSFDPKVMLKKAREVRRMRGMVFVHRFFAKGPVAEGFAMALWSDRPPLAPLLWRHHFERGAVMLVGPHIAVGPRPIRSELTGSVVRRGVRRVLYLSATDDDVSRADAPLAKGAGLTFQLKPADDAALLKLLDEDGPWYVYGPGRDAWTPVLKKRFKGPMPVKWMKLLNQPTSLRKRASGSK